MPPWMVITMMALWQLVHLGVPNCTNCHKAIMVMTSRACCIKIMHIYYTHSDMLGFEYSVCFLSPYLNMFKKTLAEMSHFKKSKNLFFEK